MRVFRSGESISKYANSFQETDNIKIPTNGWDNKLTLDVSAGYKNDSTKNTIIRLEFEASDMLNLIAGFAKGKVDKEIECIKIALSLKKQILEMEKGDKERCQVDSQLQHVTNVQQ